MKRDKPTVSIGLPVFNGEKYLQEALDSILAQTYRDFELIISDNASTDRTQQICLSYAAKDNRIRYYRNKRNLGISRNFNRVFELSSGKYFKWAAYDDLLAPEFLSKCIYIFERDPSIVLCHSKTGRINERSEITGKYDCLKVNSANANERFGQVINMRYPIWVLIFGLIRSSSLKKTQLFGEYISADRNLLAELSLIGRMHEISDYLFFRREHPQSYTDRGHYTYQEKIDCWTKNSSHVKLCFPYWRILLEYFKSVRRMPIKWPERQLSYARIVMWLIREGWLLMCIDVGMNVLEHSKYRSKFAPLVELFINHGGIV